MNYAISNIKPNVSEGYLLIENDINLHIVTDDSSKIIQHDKQLLFMSGYLVDTREPELQSNVFKNYINDIQGSWPVNDHLSGSYSTTIITKNDKIIIANDPIGPYPLYYYMKGDVFIITNNLQLIGSFIDILIDQTGIAQRLYTQDNANIGSRTILKGVKRLLPGEKIEFDISSFSLSRQYDNRLFSNICEAKIKDKEVKKFSHRIKEEIDLIKNYKKTIDIALSGGMDSRLLLGALDSNPETTCYTYGPKDSYEIKVAKKLAKIKHFHFINQFGYSRFFPDKSDITDTIRTTDSPHIMAWFELLKDISGENKILFIGDSCEALHARNIKHFSSRKDRKKNFIRHYLLNKPYEFRLNSEEDFHQWTSQIEIKYSKELNRHSYDDPVFKNITKKTILDETKADLKELFERIASHRLKYVELYDELFSWYTSSRISQAKQITHCNHVFQAISPSMGSGILILSSNLHPDTRMNYRFVNRLFKLNGFKELNKVPISHAPLFPRTSPKFLTFMMWGFRSTVDQILIKRLMKKKNPKLRYRLFNGLNWVQIYQEEGVLEKYDSYFEINHLGPQIYKENRNILEKRRNLEKWPLMNSDIMAAAVLNLELEGLGLKEETI